MFLHLPKDQTHSPGSSQVSRLSPSGLRLRTGRAGCALRPRSAGSRSCDGGCYVSTVRGAVGGPAASRLTRDTPASLTRRPRAAPRREPPRPGGERGGGAAAQPSQNGGAAVPSALPRWREEAARGPKGRGALPRCSARRAPGPLAAADSQCPRRRPRSRGKMAAEADSWGRCRPAPRRASAFRRAVLTARSPFPHRRRHLRGGGAGGEAFGAGGGGRRPLGRRGRGGRREGARGRGSLSAAGRAAAAPLLSGRLRDGPRGVRRKALELSRAEIGPSRGPTAVGHGSGVGPGAGRDGSAVGRPRRAGGEGPAPSAGLRCSVTAALGSPGRAAGPAAVPRGSSARPPRGLRALGGSAAARGGGQPYGPSPSARLRPGRCAGSSACARRGAGRCAGRGGTGETEKRLLASRRAAEGLSDAACCSSGCGPGTAVRSQV